MLKLIYLSTGLSAVFFGLGVFQLRLQKFEDGYRKDTKSMPILFGLIYPLIQIFAFINNSLELKGFEEKVKKKLTISGNPLHLIPVEFLALKQVAALGGFLFGLLLVFSHEAKPMLAVLFGMIAFFLPNLWLSETIDRRKSEIFRTQPYFMDLLTLSVQAGLDFTQAIARVVERGQPGALRDEFEKLLQDIRLGLTRRDALLGLAERTDMYEIRSFASALIQADKMGTPLAEALSTQSEMRRGERFQVAEKKANEAPVKMLFPLLFFIFPAVFIMILVPILLKFMEEGM